jgi:flagellar biosynthesis protein FlhF
MFEEPVFEIEGRSFEECQAKAIMRGGPRATVLRTDVIKVPVFLGFGRREIVKAKCYIAPPPLTRPLNMEEERKKILQTASEITKKDPQITEILDKIQEINIKIDTTQKPEAASFDHPNIESIAELLETNDFLPAFRKKIMERLKGALSIDKLEDRHELEQRALEFIGETIKIYDHEKPRKLPRIIVLIGPTGVGKTTTIAKLATKFIMEDGFTPDRISLITTDHYRLAASQQLEKYADILGSPFAAPSSTDELKKELSLQRETADIILVDTMGRSPRDSVVLGEILEMLKVCGSGAELHLTLAASTKAADIIDATAQFEPFRYESVIVTKLDETTRAGNVISALAERGKSVSYITDGQESTPHTMHKANVIRLLINLEGFDVDRRRLEEYFDNGRPG